MISNSYIRLILIFSFLLTWKQKEVFWIACKWGWHSIGPKGPFVMRKLHKISRRDTFSSEIFVIRRNNIHLLRGILDFYKGEPYSHIFLYVSLWALADPCLQSYPVHRIPYPSEYRKNKKLYQIERADTNEFTRPETSLSSASLMLLKWSNELQAVIRNSMVSSVPTVEKQFSKLRK